MVEIKNLKKKYPGFELNIDDLILKENEIVGLVGNNGSGKTTLLSLLLDLIHRDSGEVKINGKDNIGSEEWKKITGSFLDESYLMDFLAPEEYFSFIGSVFGMKIDEIKSKIQGYEGFFSGEVLQKGKYIRELSRGNKQKTGIAGALLSSPKLVILDEPFNFLDPTSRINLENVLKNFKKENKSAMMVSSHDISHISNIADRVVLIENGKIKNIYTDMSSISKELLDYFSSKETEKN